MDSVIEGYNFYSHSTGLETASSEVMNISPISLATAISITELARM